MINNWAQYYALLAALWAAATGVGAYMLPEEPMWFIIVLATFGAIHATCGIMRNYNEPN